MEGWFWRSDEIDDRDEFHASIAIAFAIAMVFVVLVFGMEWNGMDAYQESFSVQSTSTCLVERIQDHAS